MKLQLNIFTNCTEYAPSTDIIKRTYDSFCDCFGIIKPVIYMDVNPHTRKADKYAENLSKHFGNINVTKSLSAGYVESIKHSDCDYLFQLEHDWLFSKSLIRHSLDDILQVMESRGLYHFRFNKRSNINAGWETDVRLIENSCNIKNGIYMDYCLTSVLSNNPHIINKCYYLDNLMNRIKIMPGSKGIEKELSTGNLTGAIYGGLNYPATVKHLDGRKRKKGIIL